jgi:hypothetical protein
VHQRPENILIISILNIVFGGIVIVFMVVVVTAMDSLPAWMAADKPSQMIVLKTTGLLDGLTCFFGGIYFLQGANWARWIYTIESAVSGAAKAAVFYDKLNIEVLTIVFVVICIVILFLPTSNRFFKGRQRRR